MISNILVYPPEYIKLKEEIKNINEDDLEHEELGSYKLKKNILEKHKRLLYLYKICECVESKYKNNDIRKYILYDILDELYIIYNDIYIILKFRTYIKYIPDTYRYINLIHNKLVVRLNKFSF